MSFRLSPKVTLEKGDKIRVSGGPYYPSKSGSKISMGEKGVGEFVGADEKGQAIYVKFGNNSVPRFVYIGPEGISEATGTILRPHKITKLREKKKK